MAGTTPATLLFPCAGHSTRYPGMRPKWLLTTPTGALAIQQAVASVRWDGQRRIIAIRRAHEVDYAASEVLTRAFGDTIEIIVLDQDTSGPAHTVAEMIRLGDVQGAIGIKDADTFFEPLPYPGQSFVACTDLRTNLEVSRVGAKSFISINENGLINEVAEKDICSNYISSGFYGFRDASIFLDRFRTYHARFEGEMFVSHITKILLGEGEVFRPVHIDRFVDVGTHTDWRAYTAAQATYVVDIDGVIVRNQSRYFSPLWGDAPVLLQGNVDALRALQQRGAQLVFMTSRPEEHRQATIALLEACGLSAHALVMDCHHGRRYMLNDFANSNPYPSAVAINIPRNTECLKDYLDE